MAGCKIERGSIKIRTFVFLDLEVRGFRYEPDLEPRVVELSMIAVATEDFLSMKEQALKNNPKYKKDDPLPLPSIRHKYTRLYKPPKNLYPYVRDITGPSNSLSHLNPFSKDSVTSIKLFLDLPKPVCLVAHFGKIFDFPYLKAEIMRVQKESLEGILCVDSWQFFKYSKTDADLPNNSVAKENGINVSSPSKRLKYEDLPSSSLDFPTPNMHNHIEFQTPDKLKILKPDATNKSPPRRPTKNALRPLEKFMQSFKQAFPEKNLHSTPSKAKKVLFQSNKPQILSELMQTPFSQPCIFYRIYRQEYLAHRAEYDAEALLQICAFYGHEFVSWAHTHYIHF